DIDQLSFLLEAIGPTNDDVVVADGAPEDGGVVIIDDIERIEEALWRIHVLGDEPGSRRQGVGSTAATTPAAGNRPVEGPGGQVAGHSEIAADVDGAARDGHANARFGCIATGDGHAVVAKGGIGSAAAGQAHEEQPAGGGAEVLRAD